MLELNEANTKALFRRAQAWQGLKDLDKAMVRTSHTALHTHPYTNPPTHPPLHTHPQQHGTDRSVLQTGLYW